LPLSTPHPRPDLILHITSRAQWDAARASGTYVGDTLASEGFLHCSTPRQVVGVADARFRDQTDLVLLVLDPSRITAEVKYEASEPGEWFPHLYGPLNLDAVITALPFPPAPNGTFTLPSGIGTG
jgi:uncharacterized protein (DUF952 family)